MIVRGRGEAGHERALEVVCLGAGNSSVWSWELGTHVRRSQTRYVHVRYWVLAGNDSAVVGRVFTRGIVREHLDGLKSCSFDSVRGMSEIIMGFMDGVEEIAGLGTHLAAASYLRRWGTREGLSRRITR